MGSGLGLGDARGWEGEGVRLRPDWGRGTREEGKGLAMPASTSSTTGRASGVGEGLGVRLAR